MTSDNTISLFEEEEKNGQMDKKEEVVFKVLEDLRGYIFTWADVKALNPGEHERFWEATKAKMIKVIAGTVVSFTGNVRKERIIGKKKLIALGLSLSETYYHFNPKWKDPKEMEFEELMETKRAFRYKEISVYGDMIDRAIEEALKKKERRRRNKIDYELDDERGWTRVTPEEHKKARRGYRRKRKPTTVDRATWEAEEKDEDK